MADETSDATNSNSKSVTLDQLQEYCNALVHRVEAAETKVADVVLTVTGYQTAHAALVKRQAEIDASLTALHSDVSNVVGVHATRGTFLARIHAEFARMFPNLVLPHPTDGEQRVVQAPKPLVMNGIASASTLLAAGAEPDKVAAIDQPKPVNQGWNNPAQNFGNEMTAQNFSAGQQF